MTKVPNAGTLFLVAVILLKPVFRIRTVGSLRFRASRIRIRNYLYAFEEFKKIKKTLGFYSLCLFNNFLSMKTVVNVPKLRNKKRQNFLNLEPLKEKSGIRIVQVVDPKANQNVTVRNTD